MRISDWSSDVCSSDLLDVEILVDGADAGVAVEGHGQIRHIRVALPSYRNMGDGTTLLCHVVYVTSDRLVRVHPNVACGKAPVRKQAAANRSAASGRGDSRDTRPHSPPSCAYSM